MSTWSLAYLIVALLAALLGFTGIAGPASWIAELVCGLFLLLCLASLLLSRKRAPGDELPPGASPREP